MVKEVKEKSVVIEDNKIHASDTGSCEVQVAVFSNRINHLTEHLRAHPKDFSCRRGLIHLTNARRRQLKYLRDRDESRYFNLIKKLGIKR